MRDNTEYCGKIKDLGDRHYISCDLPKGHKGPHKALGKTYWQWDDYT